MKKITAYISVIDHRGQRRIKVQHILFTMQGVANNLLKNIPGRRWSKHLRVLGIYPYDVDAYENLMKVFGDIQRRSIRKSKSVKHSLSRNRKESQ